MASTSVLCWEGDVGGLLVGAFAEADADTVGGQGPDIFFATIEISLDDNAYVAVVPGDGVETANHIYCGLCVLTTFHINADEGIGGDGVFDQPGDNFLSQAEAEIHPHLGELYADVSVEVTGLDGVEEPVVDVGRMAGFLRGGDIFAQTVESGGDAQVSQGLGRVNYLIKGHPSHETGGHAAAHRRPLGEVSKGGVAREGNESGAQNRHIVLENERTFHFRTPIRGAWT